MIDYPNEETIIKTVQFWPGINVQVEIPEHLANDNSYVIMAALEKCDYTWPGGSESTSHGQHFQAWILK